QPIAQFRLPDADALQARLREVVASGGEGLMLHRRNAGYRAGRSEDLLKYKLQEDAEARVVAHAPGKGKYAGMLGALVVEMRDGRRFRLGSGFTDAQRADPPPIGALVTYRYNGLTRSGLPRFARFQRIRPDPAPPDPR
ncbi:MAG: DNA ligase, partial [Pseudoxanthomonas sp.]